MKKNLINENAVSKMKKFEIGKRYYMRFICDHECILTYTVTARTAQTITITDGENVQKCRIVKPYFEDEGEMVYPLGKYSMCPILKAERETT